MTSETRGDEGWEAGETRPRALASQADILQDAARGRPEHAAAALPVPWFMIRGPPSTQPPIESLSQRLVSNPRSQGPLSPRSLCHKFDGPTPSAHLDRERPRERC